MSDPTPTRAAAGTVPVPKEVEDLLRLVHEALRDRAAWDRAEAAAPDEPDVQSALHDRDLAARAGLVSAERAAPVARTADRWLSRFRSLLVAVLGGTVAGIASLAFFTSFEAIKAYANTSHGIDPHHDFAVPLLVDSFIVVATGADLWFATTGRRRQAWELWWPKALLAGAAAVSFILNVAHVQK